MIGRRARVVGNRRGRLALYVTLVLALSVAAATGYRAWVDDMLVDAATVADLGKLETALAWGANPNARNKYGNPAIALALKTTSFTCARLLVDSGASLDGTDAQGKPVVLLAAFQGTGAAAEPVRAMIARSGDPQSRRTAYGIMLCWALRNGDRKMAMSLLAGDLDVDAVWPMRGVEIRPLHLAAGAGNLDIVRILLDRGADVNARGGASGSTPLISAACTRRLAVARELIERGADVSLRDQAKNRSALDWAEQAGWKEADPASLLQFRKLFLQALKLAHGDRVAVQTTSAR